MPNSKTSNLKKTSSNAKEDVCISLVGPAGCGKSALLVKYLTKRFIGEYDPYYEGCWTKHENIDNTELNIQIMDTYDEDRRNLEKYFKWSDLLILVYSITNKQSFVKIREYLESICELAARSESANEKKFLKVILLGNKIDMERHRQITKQEIESLLRKYSPPRSSTPTTTKFTDSTNTITNESAAATTSNSNNNQANRNRSSSLTANVPTLGEYVSITHVESTSCEEYELVKNLFGQLIKEYKREKEIFLASVASSNTTTGANYSANNNNNNNNINNNQAVSSSSSSGGGGMSQSQQVTTSVPPPAPPLPQQFDSKFNNFLSSSKSSNKPAQRGKSPKSNQLISQDISPANLSIINANLNANTGGGGGGGSTNAINASSMSTPPAHLSISSQNMHLSAASSANPIYGSTNMMNTASGGGGGGGLTSSTNLVGSTSALLVNARDNMSTASLSRLQHQQTGETGFETPSDVGSSAPAAAAAATAAAGSSHATISAATTGPVSSSGNSSASIKKNSKFPFFTKILNKS